MIELNKDRLVFTFPEVHEDARFSIEFQRTLRIPDDGSDYPLPAGLGRFPLRHVDDHASSVPPQWLQRGGVMMPMYQSEALWINFDDTGYPFAVKIAAGKINAVTGGPWESGLHFGPSPSDREEDELFLGWSHSEREVSGQGDGTPEQGDDSPEQDYVVLPDQPWLDGFNVGSGRIRQFVAMPLGEGYTAEEQVTGEAEHGGLQILAYPMKTDAYEEWQKIQRDVHADLRPLSEMAEGACAAPDMGLGLGGLMRQDISADPHEPSVWDVKNPARCFVHLTNSVQWAAITGQAPPTEPATAKDYRNARVPWFNYYATGDILPGSPQLAKLDSVATIAAMKAKPLPDNDPIPIDRVTLLRKPRNIGQVRELAE